MQNTFVPKVPHDPCPNAGGLHAPDVGQHLAAHPHRQVQPDHLLCSHLCTCSTAAGLPLAPSQHDQPNSCEAVLRHVQCTRSPQAAVCSSCLLRSQSLYLMPPSIDFAQQQRTHEQKIHVAGSHQARCHVPADTPGLLLCRSGLSLSKHPTWLLLPGLHL